MSVTKLSVRPNPPNSNLARAMFVWVTSQASQDPLDTDTDQQALINFCGANGVNVLFLDIWRYLGGSNGSATKTARLRLFLEVAHLSGIRVYALAGDLGWGQTHSWVMSNIVEQLLAYQAGCNEVSQQFDGACLDVEYWADENTYPPENHLPGLCDLIKAIRSRSDNSLSVGCFAAFYLAANDRTPVEYAGALAVDGQHLMDVADFVVVGAYRDTSAEQILVFQSWYDYAKQEGKNFGLYCGTETTDVSPANITYFGSTKALMEIQLTAVSTAFVSATNSVFIGHAIHSYDGYKVMP